MHTYAGIHTRARARHVTQVAVVWMFGEFAQDYKFANRWRTKESMLEAQCPQPWCDFHARLGGWPDRLKPMRSIREGEVL